MYYYNYSGEAITEEKNLSGNKCPTKINQVVYRIGSIEKYSVEHVDTYYNIITLINIRDKHHIVYVNYKTFKDNYNFIHF